MGFRKIFYVPLLLTNWEIFWDFGKVIWKILSTFQKVPLLTLNKGCHLAGYFSKFPTKIFLPSLTLNKGRRLWGCFRENSQKIFRPHLFSKLQDHLWGRFRKKRYVAKKVSPLKSVNWAGKPFTFNYKIFFWIPRKSVIILDKSASPWYT